MRLCCYCVHAYDSRRDCDPGAFIEAMLDVVHRFEATLERVEQRAVASQSALALHFQQSWHVQQSWYQESQRALSTLAEKVVMQVGQDRQSLRDFQQELWTTVYTLLLTHSRDGSVRKFVSSLG